MLERAVQLHPGSSRAYYIMGVLFDKKAMPEQATVMYRKAREAAAR
jgi:Tfp pilus assembly protein PilF